MSDHPIGTITIPNDDDISTFDMGVVPPEDILITLLDIQLATIHKDLNTVGARDEAWSGIRHYLKLGADPYERMFGYLHGSLEGDAKGLQRREAEKSDKHWEVVHRQLARRRMRVWRAYAKKKTELPAVFVYPGTEGEIDREKFMGGGAEFPVADGADETNNLGVRTRSNAGADQRETRTFFFQFDPVIAIAGSNQELLSYWQRIVVYVLLLSREALDAGCGFNNQTITKVSPLYIDEQMSASASTPVTRTDISLSFQSAQTIMEGRDVVIARDSKVAIVPQSSEI